MSAGPCHCSSVSLRSDSVDHSIRKSQHSISSPLTTIKSCNTTETSSQLLVVCFTNRQEAAWNHGPHLHLQQLCLMQNWMMVQQSRSLLQSLQCIRSACSRLRNRSGRGTKVADRNLLSALKADDGGSSNGSSPGLCGGISSSFWVTISHPG